MDRQEFIRNMLEKVSNGEMDIDSALKVLEKYPFSDIGFAKIDHQRGLRQLVPEVVYCPRKSSEQVREIVLELLTLPNGPIIVSRASKDKIDAILDLGEEVVVTPTADGLFMASMRHLDRRDEKVSVITAGTADIPVAKEACAVLEAFGVVPRLFVDCGVAGLSRILSIVDEFTNSDAVIVVAGMEGALASVVAGLTSSPVLCIPTSVGYGSSLGGVTALLSMLSSCSPGVSVVGIDNGFGAAAGVLRILDRR